MSLSNFLKIIQVNTLKGDNYQKSNVFHKPSALMMKGFSYCDCLIE